MKRSITRRFQFYVTGSIILAAIAVFAIVREVIKDEYTQHFTQEMETAKLVLKNYLEGRFTLLRSGVDILLSDPRFLASIAEGDPQTAQQEVSNFRSVIKADLIVIADTAGKKLAYDHVKSAASTSELGFLFDSASVDFQESFLMIGQEVYQMLAAPIRFASGELIGRLQVGYLLDDTLIARFGQLTGSEILLVVGGSVISFSAGASSEAGDFGEIIRKDNELWSAKVHTQRREDGDYLMMSHSLSSPDQIAIVLARSLDSQLGPATRTISHYLIGLTFAASVLSLLLIYRFTARNLTEPVSRLVTAANHISEGHLKDSIKPLNDDELGFLASCFDDMRKTLIQRNEALTIAHQEKIQSERLATIGQLAAGIIHDFKSPMTAISLSVEAITTGLGGEDRREHYCRTVKSQVARMVNMTQDLLDYAHGSKSVQLEKIDFTETIRGQVEFHRERFEKQRIGLHCQIPERSMVSIDPHKFRRVLDNLLNNAFEVLSPGNQVTIEVRQTPANLIILVSDDGPGIPEDIINDIFKPFVTQGKAAGTGLGLAISQKIIGDHGGGLTVESLPGQGATFTITLPASLIHQQQAENQEFTARMAV